MASNNSVTFQISPRDSRLRVIYMEGTGANEYRYLQDALHEDPDIKCTSMVVGNQNDARPRLSRVDEPARGFPTTREELFGYDVVICSDIARTAFTAEQLDVDSRAGRQARRRVCHDRRHDQLRLRRMGPDRLGRHDPRRHERPGAECAVREFLGAVSAW